MSLRRFLEITFPDQPAFIKDSWVQGVPLRHLFMAGTIARMAEAEPERPIRILEIGSWMGSSCLTWGEALHRFAGGRGHIVCIDPLVPYFDAEANKAALEADNAAVQSSQSGLVDEMSALLAEDYVHDILLHNVATIAAPVTVAVLRQPSSAVLPTLPDASFDLVYVDGDHTYDAARFDLTQACRLVRDGGILCGDDLEAQLHEIDPDFARAHTHVDFPTDPATRRQYHPGVTLAVGEILGSVLAYHGYWLAQRDGSDFIDFRLDNLPLMIPSHFPPAIRNALIAELRGG